MTLRMSRPHIGLLLTAIFACSTTAAAQSSTPGIVLKIAWQEIEPSAIFWSTEGRGTRSISPVTDPMQISLEGTRAKNPITIRFDTAHGKSLLTLLPRYGNEPFEFQLQLPKDIDCNTANVVRPLISQIGSGDVSSVANATLHARHLVENSACGPGNERQLKEAVFTGYRRLTELSSVFAMPEIEWGSYATRARRAHKDAMERRLMQMYSDAQNARDLRDYGALDVQLQRLRGLLVSPKWTPIFRSTNVSSNDLKHLEIQGWYNRAVSLRNDGDFRGALKYSRSLAEAADDPAYRTVLTRPVSGITPSIARSIHAGIEKEIRPNVDVPIDDESSPI